MFKCSNVQIKLKTKNKKIWIYLFFISVFIFFFLPHLDTDLGWHLKYGQYFWQTGRFLTNNHLSVLMPDYIWPNSYSFYQVLIFSIYKILGLFGLSLMSSLVFSLIFYLVFKLTRSLTATQLTFLITIIPSWGILRLGFRAQIFTLLSILLVFWQLKNWPKKVWLLPGLFFLWTNLHGAFVLGLGILLLFCLFNFNKLKPWLILISSFLVSLINPYGLKVYQEAWRHFHQVRLDQLIAEWVPPQPLWLGLAVISFLVSSWLFVKIKKNRYLWVVFINQAGFLYLTFQAKRNLPLFFLTSGLIFDQSSFFRKNQHNVNLKSASRALTILLLVFGILIRLPKTLKTDFNHQGFCDNSFVSYPCQATNWLKTNKQPGNIFNMYRWGGFLAWELPDSKIFVDGRMPAWPHPSGKSPYTIFLEILQAKPSWHQQLVDYQIDYIFIPPGTFLDLDLSATKSADKQDWPSDSEGWQEIYRDQKAVIYESI